MERKVKPEKEVKSGEDESEVSEESEPEFSGSGSSDNEDIPLKAEDDDSFKPTSKVDSSVAPTRHS